ncbi:MAG: DUF4178 domain-containing protein [Bryobacteraceae bacterium]|nr:DUF4178 domain-containing protein [Bryobacteraceae bacterium]
MSRLANCPSCGAQVQFRFAQAVQTACPYCQSVIVRTNVDLEKVGEVAALPPDPSPIQLYTEGIIGNKAFQVVGRLTYSYEQGFWNEWHLLFHDNTTGWLADAQAQYAYSQLVAPPSRLPAKGKLKRGQTFHWPQGEFTLTHLTVARYVGFEGELPFATDGRHEETVFADLKSPTAAFATIDYSEDPPLLFMGRIVTFDELQLKNLKMFEGW